MGTFRDPNTFIDGAVQAIEPQSIGSLSDIDGATIDRQDFGNPQCALFKFSLKSSNASDSITFTIQESSDGSSWSDVQDSAALTQDNGEDKVLVNLNDFDRYIRVQFDESDSGQDVSGSPVAAAEVILCGAKESQTIS